MIHTQSNCIVGPAQLSTPLFHGPIYQSLILALDLLTLKRPAFMLCNSLSDVDKGQSAGCMPIRKSLGEMLQWTSSLFGLPTQYEL